MALQQISFPFGDEQPDRPKPESETAAPPIGNAMPADTTATPYETAAPASEPPVTPAPAASAPAPPTGELFVWEPLPGEAPPQSPADRDPAGKTPAPKGPREGRTEGRGRKSVKALAAAADLVDIPGDDVLFQKQYYAIGEVAAMFKVNTSLIRFWETEFSDIKPRKNKKGDRYFTPADIKTLELIHFLLRHKKLTIEGAKEYLKANRQDGAAKLELVRSLEKIKAFLLELKARL